MNDCSLNDPMIVQRYHDGELAADDAVRFERHLASCPVCMEALASWTEVGDWLREALVPSPPADLTERFVRRARERQLQGSRRIAWGLLAAASLLLVSSLFLVGYTQAGQGGVPSMVAQWEENVIAPPVEDEEFTDLESRTLVAIHIQRAPASEEDDD